MNPAMTTGILLPTLLLAFSPALADPPRITIWHGKTQRVGHLGVAQNDFNVLGNVSDPDAILSGLAIVGVGPEPSTLVLLSLGMLTLGVGRRRRCRG